MTDSSVVHRSVHQGPATHVLAIGVGRYPHLIGGDDARLPEHQGLGQLTSPPASARLVARWFAESFHNPARPLGSVRLLLSEADGAPFVHPTTGEALPVPAATVPGVEAAFKAWMADGDTSPENLLIFYFSGHGLANGPYTALLAEDFGRDPNNALDGAVDFYRNRLGMSRCKARQQLYLVDACRTGAAMTRYSADYAGRVFVQPSATAGGVQRPVLYSTLAGEQAYGRAGEPSHFAEALIAALRGAGGDRSQGDWRVRTSTLHLAIEAHIARRVRAGLATAQIPPAEDLTTFDVHHLTSPPDVPVIVSCRPRAALEVARLRCLSSGALLHERPPAAAEWEIALRVGDYDFEASFDAGTFVSARRDGEYVYPPELNVPLEVSP